MASETAPSSDESVTAERSRQRRSLPSTNLWGSTRNASATCFGGTWCPTFGATWRASASARNRPASAGRISSAAATTCSLSRGPLPTFCRRTTPTQGSLGHPSFGRVSSGRCDLIAQVQQEAQCHEELTRCMAQLLDSNVVQNANSGVSLFSLDHCDQSFEEDFTQAQFFERHAKAFPCWSVPIAAGHWLFIGPG